MKHMKIKQSTADPCLYHKWTNNGLSRMASWIDVSIIMGSDKAMSETKQKLMGLFNCKDCSKLEEYVGCKITRKGNHSLRFTQPVLIQSLSEKFELPSGCYKAPAMADNVLTR